MIRWRREPKEKGLAAILQIYRGYDLWDDNKEVGRVRAICNIYDFFQIDGYYFVINYKEKTLNSLWDKKCFETEDEAKKEAVKLYKEWKNEGKKS